MASTYALPSSSKTRAPSPRTIVHEVVLGGAGEGVEERSESHARHSSRRGQASPGPRERGVVDLALGHPERAATSATAVLRSRPAWRLRRTASSTSVVGRPGPPGAPPSTSTYSPGGGAGHVVHGASQASRATTSSCSLVSSRPARPVGRRRRPRPGRASVASTGAVPRRARSCGARGHHGEPVGPAPPRSGEEPLHHPALRRAGRSRRAQRRQPPGPAPRSPRAPRRAQPARAARRGRRCRRAGVGDDRHGLAPVEELGDGRRGGGLGVLVGDQQARAGDAGVLQQPAGAAGVLAHDRRRRRPGRRPLGARGRPGSRSVWRRGRGARSRSPAWAGAAHRRPARTSNASPTWRPQRPNAPASASTTCGRASRHADAIGAMRTVFSTTPPPSR